MVVGGKVVVVVGGRVVVVDGEDAPWFDVVDVVVGGGVAVVEVLGGAVVGAGAGVVADDVLAPGCSFATTTPMATVPPVARRMANPVSRRSRAAARRLVSGELACREDLVTPAPYEGGAYANMTGCLERLFPCTRHCGRHVRRHVRVMVCG